MTKLNKQQSSDLWFITDLAGFAPTEVLDGLGTNNGNTLKFFKHGMENPSLIGHYPIKVMEKPGNSEP